MQHHGHPIAGSLVRARNSRGTVVGVGFLAAPGLVCTCAHVITEALDLPDEQPTPPVDEVTLDFPFVSDATVRAVVARWLPIQSAGGGDIAILRVTTVVPASTAPVSLLVERNLAGRHVEVHGISERAGDDRWTEGIVGHRLPTGWVQLEGTAITGYRVQPGFSGAPVWDPEAHGVVGMVVAADQEPTTEIAFLIPASWLIEAEPTLDHAPSMRAVYPRVAHVGPIGSAAPSLPSGTVAFLFTDIEGSTRLWEKDPRAMAVAVA